MSGRFHFKRETKKDKICINMSDKYEAVVTKFFKITTKKMETILLKSLAK